MFGYIRPQECELKVKELALYRAYYCGLCKTIGRRFGQGARAVLNYDCTFLALLLSAFTDAPGCELGGCFVKPYRAKRPIAPPQESLDYAADVNVLLAWYQQSDDWRDERKLAALGGRTLLAAAAARARRIRPELSRSVATHIAQLSTLEKQRASGTDAPADAFGDLMRDVIVLSPDVPESERAPAAWMFYNLGRWIYLVDAWEDRQRDEKRLAYNPFLASGTTREDAAFLLYMSLSEAEKGYDLLTLKSHAPVLDNIMHLGCRERTCAALKEKTNESV